MIEDVVEVKAANPNLNKETIVLLLKYDSKLVNIIKLITKCQKTQIIQM